MAGPPAPSKKTVSDLKASILSPALTSNFECSFQPPGKVVTWLGERKSAGLGNYSSLQDKLISLSCSEAALPGSSLATHEINNDFTGVTERHAYRRQYDDRASFTFYVDNNYEIVYFFENWIAYIVNEQRSNTVAFGPGMDQPNFSYRVNFPKNYQQTIYITKFEKDYSRRPLVYSFIQAYPISIDSMPVSYDSSQLLKCTVSFTYSRYIIGGGEVFKQELGAAALGGELTLSAEDRARFGTPFSSSGSNRKPPAPTPTQIRQGVVRDAQGFIVR